RATEAQRHRGGPTCRVACANQSSYSEPVVEAGSMAGRVGLCGSVPCMLDSTSPNAPMPHAASRASKRSEKPAKRRRTADRSCLDAHVDVVTELDRRSSRTANPYSRLNRPEPG